MIVHPFVGSLLMNCCICSLMVLQCSSVSHSLDAQAEKGIGHYALLTVHCKPLDSQDGEVHMEAEWDVIDSSGYAHEVSLVPLVEEACYVCETCCMFMCTCVCVCVESWLT